MLKQFLKQPMKFISNNKGMSILEILVAVGLMSIVSIGVITMMQNASIDQKKNLLLSTLRELKLRIENNIRDQGAWSKTVNGALNTSSLWTNLRTQTAVTAIPYTAPEKIVLYDAAGNVSFNLLDFSGTSGNGYTEGGAPCTTFTTSGNDACPISYRLVIAADCGGASTCLNPQLKVAARLLFKPSTNGVLNRFVNLIQQIGTNTIADGSANEGKYDAIVKRTATQVNSIFSIKSSKTASNTNTAAAPLNTPPNSDCLNNGAGLCSTSGAAVHPLTSPPGPGWTIVDNAAGLVDTSPGSGGFRITAAGTYDCKVSMVAFGTSVTGYLMRNTSQLATGSAVAGRWGTGTVQIQSRFEHSNVADVFRIYQRCAAVASNPLPADPDQNVRFCSLGMAVQPYTTPTDIVTVECTRVTDPNN